MAPPRTSGKRSYRQLCGLAAALDVVGERWTMLIVRDLLLGPRRYTDLLEGLPGIGEGLLAQRLRQLEGIGCVERAFSGPPLNAVLYRLTENGRELGDALLPLARWGLRLLGSLGDDVDLRADHLAVAMRSRFDPTQTIGVHERYEIRVDDHPFTITADDGSVTVTRGAAPDAAVHVRLDMATLLEIGVGTLDHRDARRSGRVEVTGAQDAIARYGRMLRAVPSTAA